ncbi:MAG: 2-phospho-L-lactate transferase CofD family protein, partial [Candidatus Aureabacteria bacterium]|nr:2-phospho-L-lactate transferase CofD family protein [Candidatus Auribacterota bacterium]
TQPGETQGYTASQHVQALLDHAGARIVDYVVCNNGKVPAELLGRYLAEGAAPVVIDTRELRGKSYRVIVEDVISASDYVRHGPDKLADIIVRLIQR